MSEQRFYYAHTTPEGLVYVVQDTPYEMSVSDVLHRIDSYDVTLPGRYILNGVAGPAPQEGYYWEWDESSQTFVEQPIPVPPDPAE